MKSSTLKMVRSVSKKCVTLLALLSLCSISFSSMAAETELTAIQGKITDGKLILTFTGRLEASDDGKKWVAIDATSPYTVEMTGTEKFFRACSENGEISKNFTIPLSDTVNLDMIWVKPGTFIMGSPADELGRWDDETQRSVKISQGYWLGKYEITQAQYKAVTGENPSYFEGDNLPVERVSWNDATNFCAKLTEIEKAAGRLPAGYEYVLPTEAQWEYACRAGTTTALNSGKNLTDMFECSNMGEVGWYYCNSDDKTHPVGEKPANTWGFYDMHGNVFEWCLDWFPGYEGELRVLRGGCFEAAAYNCRSAVRFNNYPSVGNYYDGFRVALSPVQ